MENEPDTYKYLIDSDAASLEELHEHFKRDLELPDFYGENLDALWDSITGLIGTPATIEWRNYDKLRGVLGPQLDDIRK